MSDFLVIVESDYLSQSPMIFYLNADTKDEAIEEIKEEMIGKWVNGENYTGYDGGQIQTNRDLDVFLETKLYEISNEFDVPVKEWFKQAQEHTKQAITERKEQEERAEYERLQVKFGSS